MQTMVKKPANRLSDALDALDAIPDAIKRWEAANEMTDAVREATSRVAQIRAQIVRELRAQGMTYRAIGEKLDIHFTRVKQLESGEPATKWKRSPPKADDGTPDVEP